VQDTVATVIEDGRQSIYWDHAEHNSTKRIRKVRVGRVRYGHIFIRDTSEYHGRETPDEPRTKI